MINIIIRIIFIYLQALSIAMILLPFTVLAMIIKCIPKWSEIKKFYLLIFTENKK